MTDVEKSFWPEMKAEQYKRRNISGIYIFDKFPSDEKQQPTCIEDCQQETRRNWIMGKGDRDYAKGNVSVIDFSADSGTLTFTQSIDLEKIND